MVLWGTIINAIAIICGSLLGIVFNRISEGIRTTVMQGIGMMVCVLGVSMALKTENMLIPIFSLVIGGVIGELLHVNDGLEKLGVWIERIVGKRGKGNIATGFVTATLMYCVGAMAILGAMDSGLRLNHDILYTKSILDGFTAIIFTSTLGIGVVFSAIPVFLYQGLIALASTFISAIVSQDMLAAMIKEITAVGGVLIIGIGINILDLKKINVANLLPAIIISVLLVPLIAKISQYL